MAGRFALGGMSQLLGVSKSFFHRFNKPVLMRNVSRISSRSYSGPSSSQSSDDQHLTLSLTDNCVKQIHKIAGSGSFLRVLVDSGGCSGFQYKFELDDKINEDDRVFEKEGARVIIDGESLKLINGSVIDFTSELIRSAFHVQSNPNADHGCSCGASFNVKL